MKEWIGACCVLLHLVNSYTSEFWAGGRLRAVQQGRGKKKKDRKKRKKKKDVFSPCLVATVSLQNILFVTLCLLRCALSIVPNRRRVPE